MGKEAGQGKSRLSAPRKRASSGASAMERAAKAFRNAAELLNLKKPRFVFNMLDEGERRRLIQVLWTGD